ncbi:hypothetical protein [Macrococcus armenti]|uniref:hypothetical protein n=1 Tax=Macrococcus armenti TaxID=2875764 RepID=UPI001F4BF734|nr:hypothetical protein [Macrococcus armenti]
MFLRPKVPFDCCSNNNGLKAPSLPIPWPVVTCESKSFFSTILPVAASTCIFQCKTTGLAVEIRIS